MNVHITVEFHVGCNGLGDLSFFKFKVFVLEDTVSAGIRHNVSDLRIVGIITLIQSSKDFDITIIIVSCLVVEGEVTGLAIID